MPWGQVARIAFNSIRVRFFRSAITIAILTLAVTFVVFTWQGYEILNAVFPQLDQAGKDRILARGYDVSGGRFGTGPKEVWLGFLSLLVCVTGILNAHLMSVTERFREIGTLKCLGALDSIILKIFLLEAAYQGLIAGVLGSVLGILAATLSSLVEIGSGAFVYFPAARTALTFGYSVLLSLFLSVLGVIYPALIASRMQPAAAMRSE